MKKSEATARIYTFDDMKIYTIRTEKVMTVYKEPEDGILLRYWFSVQAEAADEIDIEALHENGYFDE